MSAYRALEDSNIPDDLIEIIAKKVHNMYFIDLKPNIELRKYPFLNEILKNNHLYNFKNLCRIYPKLKITSFKSNIEIYVFIKLNETRFIYYNSGEWNSHKLTVMYEGKFIDDYLAIYNFNVTSSNFSEQVIDFTRYKEDNMTDFIYICIRRLDYPLWSNFKAIYTHEKLLNSRVDPDYSKTFTQDQVSKLKSWFQDNIPIKYEY